MSKERELWREGASAGIRGVSGIDWEEARGVTGDLNMSWKSLRVEAWLQSIQRGWEQGNGGSECELLSRSFCSKEGVRNGKEHGLGREWRKVGFFRKEEITSGLYADGNNLLKEQKWWQRRERRLWQWGAHKPLYYRPVATQLQPAVARYLVSQEKPVIDLFLNNMKSDI